MKAIEMIRQLEKLPPDTILYTTSYELDGDYVQVTELKPDEDENHVIILGDPA